MESDMKAWIEKYGEEERARTKYADRLRDVDLMVLDNSIRESTVGQLRGHTVSDKIDILDQVRLCGFTEAVVASFSHMTRVDDEFVAKIVAGAKQDRKCEDLSGLWSFSEVVDIQASRGMVPNPGPIPVGLKKMLEFGLHNVIFEVDLGDTQWNYDKFSVEDMIQLLKDRFEWVHENLPWPRDSTDHTGPRPPVRIALNLRDPPEALPKRAERVFKMASFIASLPESMNFFALLFEEPTGVSLPATVGNWARGLREILDKHGSKARLLVHVHERYGLADAANLQAIADGADGIWASLCTEGAAIGTASSCVTLLNLIRHGNTKVLKRYNCKNLRSAAIEVTKVTTGREPHPKQPIFGPRAVDLVFADATMNHVDFDLGEFFGEQAPIRITTLASEGLIIQRLVNVFGEDPQFSFTMAHAMKEQMLDDLRTGRKEEYMSPCGLAMLFDRSGGKMTEDMAELIARNQVQSPKAKILIQQIRNIWDAWDLTEENQKDEMLAFDSFYNGFMAPYFSCYRCADTVDALRCLDMDSDGQVDWNEFLVYLKWALNQYPDIESAEELLDIAFRKGLIPSMRDEKLRRVLPSNDDSIRKECWTKLTCEGTVGVLTLVSADDKNGVNGKDGAQNGGEKGTDTVDGKADGKNGVAQTNGAAPRLVTSAFKAKESQLFRLVPGNKIVSRSGLVLALEKDEDGKMRVIGVEDEKDERIPSWRIEDGKIVCNTFELALDGGSDKGDDVWAKSETGNSNQIWTWTHQLY